MTFSIIARDPNSEAFGVAVSTAVPCVGAMVPWAKSGVGAIATQSYTNVELGRDGLKLLEMGLSPRAALEGMLADDPGASLRQVAGIDAKGRTFAHSGADCVDWYGSREGEDYSVQGNMLVGKETVDAMAEAFEGERRQVAGHPADGGARGGPGRRWRQSRAALGGAPRDADGRGQGAAA